MNTVDKISKLEKFKQMIYAHESRKTTYEDKQKLRTLINQQKAWVRQQIIEAGCFHTLTIGPPPAIGGVVMDNIDPLQMIFERPYLHSMVPHVIDMIDQTIGVLKSPPEEKSDSTTAMVTKGVVKNYAFIAMPMEKDNDDLEDVLDAIKEGANRCGVQAERIDEPESNERITDRIVESIEKAEFVIVDLTSQKPNVYWEAGYAHGLGKIPIYIAKHGTKLEFDLKDYPVIFFKNLRSIKNSLEKRIRGLAQKN
jgi:hypothetical protein